MDVKKEKRTILIVEDNSIQKEMLVEIMCKEFDVLCADNGAQALEIIKENAARISAILTDIDMPVMDGYELLEKIQGDVATKTIPVIIVTGLKSVDEEEKCLEIGAADFVAKPYNPTLCIARTKNVIRMRETVSALHELEIDQLTGVYRKQAFFHHAKAYIEKHPNKQFGIIGIDIENFTYSNSQYGVERCDMFLSYVGNLIRKQERFCVVGRFSGDRFVVLFECDQLDEDFLLNWPGDEFGKSAPIPHQIAKKGVYAPLDPEISIAISCDRAFMAIRDIKGVYEKDLMYYDENLGKQLLDEQHIQESMDEALKDEQFIVHYQPKHDSNTGEIIGAEALVRWIHPEFGFMSPGQFIPIFERNGFIAKLDSFVIGKVCQEINRWKEMGIPLVPLSVNISRRDFFEDKWMDKQIAMIDRYGVDHSLIHMEVTESLYAEYIDLIINQVKKVRDLGYKIEMDDFGAGYSSLGMLSDFPLDVIKLDISFVRKIKANEIVIENVINLAHRMGYSVVAEGVENEEQFAILKALGCDFVQGYLFSKPLRSEDFEDYLKSHKHGDGVSEELEQVSFKKKWSQISDELEVKDTLVRCLESMALDTDTEKGIRSLIEIIGKFYEAKSCFILERDADKSFSPTHVWKSGEEAETEASLTKLSKAEVMKWVENKLAVPICENGDITGMIGVDAASCCDTKREVLEAVSRLVIRELLLGRMMKQ